MSSYIIVEETKNNDDYVDDIIKAFNGNVNKKLAQGYQPVGGITFLPGRNTSNFTLLQAMMQKPSLSGGKGSKRHRIRKNVSSRRR